MSNNNNLALYGAAAAAAYYFRSQIAAAIQAAIAPAAAVATAQGSAGGGASTGYSCIGSDGSNLCYSPMQAATAAATSAAGTGASPAQQAVAAQVAATSTAIPPVPTQTTASGYSIQGNQLIAPTGLVVPYTPYSPPPPPAAGGPALYTFSGSSGYQTGLTALDLYNSQIATLKANAAATPAPPGYRIDTYGGLVKLSGTEGNYL